MSFKKIFVTMFPVFWLIFFLADLFARMTARSTVFRKWQPFIAVGRGIRKVKGLSVFALIMMNLFLMYRWIGAAEGCGGTKGA